MIFGELVANTINLWNNNSRAVCIKTKQAVDSKADDNNRGENVGVQGITQDSSRGDN